jgi:tRNA-splicing ligase RtcB (3'-phosphate/5'-hydroxy nucleic acid ligase)
MKKGFISGNDLKKIGFPQSKAMAFALDVISKNFRTATVAEILEKIKPVLANPKAFVNDIIWGRVAQALLPAEKKSLQHELLKNRIDYTVYGASEIEEGARNQMEIAMKLPVTVAGALMPDAHQGYGLPIGGVLATDNAVIPYGVGVDIGCRMCLSVFPLDEKYFARYRTNLKNILVENTRFGREVFKSTMEHEVLERPTFRDIAILKNLKDRAAEQIGSSGSGNHFVEFGLVELIEPNEWKLPARKYLAALSHSGSRGLGAQVAHHYTKVARGLCHLPGEASNLAWLDLDSEAGQEYWAAMNLAGDYASANHYQIHQRLSRAMGEKALFVVENHHNFAWKEKLRDGREVIVHRKGATPAGKGVLGIIPGSMTTPGFIVRGKGQQQSLDSASHGAGRLMSRTRAKQSITGKMLKQELQRSHVDLIGGGLDEAPMAYKDIHKVMQYQGDLVDIAGIFTPGIVRMCGDDSPSED